ncbi:MAG: hypothetical protein R3E31_29385 [Chloroflexota bacterium]|nr:hypothetical protein [Anaerolineales bacterium]MCB8965361.1 hypothetical protein [Ardenticatenaceae bacterium]
MYTEEDIASMSTDDLHDGLMLFFGDFEEDVLQKAANLLKNGVLSWAQVEGVIGEGPGSGLDVLVNSAS